MNVEGKPGVKKQLHTAGGDVERWREKRPPAGDSRSGQVKPALLFFFCFIDFIASGSKVIYIIKERNS